MLKSTLALKKSDDLFEKSSMSFGDHLEELRQALIRASIWLMGGLCVGVPMATSVVAYMQRPLEAALDQFYREQSIREMEKSSNGSVDPVLKEWMQANQKRSEVIFVDKNSWGLYFSPSPFPLPSPIQLLIPKLVRTQRQQVSHQRMIPNLRSKRTLQSSSVFPLPLRTPKAFRLPTGSFRCESSLRSNRKRKHSICKKG